MSWKLPTATVELILRDCAASLVLCDRARLPLCPADLPRVVFEEDFAALLNHGPFAAITPQPADSAMFLYTSGSSGRPKGVVLSHMSHLWVIEMRLRASSPEERRVLVAAPPYHMNALAVCQAALAQHDTFILLPSFTVQSYIETAAIYRATALTSVPTMIAMMMIAMILRETALLERTDLSAVTTIRMGSAPVSEGLMEAGRRAFLHAVITNGYGTTEAGPIVFSAYPDGRPTPDLSVGVAHPHVEPRLVAGDDGETDEGVLEMRCPALMTGYHNLPEAPCARGRCERRASRLRLDQRRAVDLRGWRRCLVDARGALAADRCGALCRELTATRSRLDYSRRKVTTSTSR